MRATDEILAPLAEAERRLRALAGGRRARNPARRSERHGFRENWIGLRRNGAYRVTAVEQQPLLPPWVALALLLGTLLLAWRLEGR